LDEAKNQVSPIDRIHFSVECRVSFVLRFYAHSERPLEKSNSATTTRTGHFAIADGTNRPSGMEMQSRSRYVWISSKKPPAGSVYASRFRIMERPGVPANWVVVMRRTAPADGTCRLTFFPYIPPAYIAQPASSLLSVIFPFLSFDTKDSPTV